MSDYKSRTTATGNFLSVSEMTVDWSTLLSFLSPLVCCPHFVLYPRESHNKTNYSHVTSLNPFADALTLLSTHRALVGYSLRAVSRGTLGTVNCGRVG